jgi:oxygen-independent coproporphyrinogen-3 oxidase
MPGVYLSYPFCAQKCTYCNFASGVFPREIASAYPGALRTELRSTNWPWTPETVYWGGGTPSQLDPEILRSLHLEIPGSPWREATLEAAPGGITREKAEAWRRAGINRVSLGVQSFIAKELARTGRKHTAQIVADEVAILRNAGLTNFNIDLIAGLPHQTAQSWSESLDWIERHNAPHVSVYMLEVDEDSRLGSEIIAFGKRYGAQEVPTEDQIAEFYETAAERLAAMNIARYEISNFARHGHESIHNLKYWRREPYLGFGSDAHSFDGQTRRQNVESASDYVSRINSGESPIASQSEADNQAEPYFLGLRLAEGIPISQLPEHAKHFLAEGLLEQSEGRVRLTSRGILLSNEVFAEFILPAVP